MKSPFPGMDPYIEARGLWRDFHSHLIEAISRQLLRTIPDKYLVLTGERAYVVLAESDGKQEHSFSPDVGVARILPPVARSNRPGAVAVAEPAADTEPVSLRAFVAEQFRENFIEIYAVDPTRRLITCIEILSPSNKDPRTSGWKQYRRKRQALLMGQANFVEIDLLRRGRKMPMLDPWPDCPCTLLVARQEGAAYCRVWKGYYQRSLPIIPIPLDTPEEDAPLGLQTLIDDIYAEYRYHRLIDYTKPLKPALSAEENVWLQEQLKARQLQA